MLSWFQHRKKEIFLLIIFIALGAFLRTYQWVDWLHFEVDQSYDAKVVNQAITGGIGQLPLLGQVAGSEALRLGPAYYYLEYASALIFGNTPQGHASFVIILSIAAIFLFYVVCRRYFAVPVALALLAIFSVSQYLVLYSRFSWNPNILPFFFLLITYALLRSVSKQEPRQSFWFLIAAGAMAIATQLHFNSFFIVPAVIAVFLIAKRPHFNLRIWLGAVAIILLVYAPVITNEIVSGGENIQYFTHKIDSENQKESPALATVALQGVHYTAFESFLVLSGIDKIHGKNEFSLQRFIPNLQCGTASQLTCGSNFIAKILATAILVGSLVMLVIRLLKNMEAPKKDFLVLMAIWSVLAFLYFSALIFADYTMRPRFFLLTAPLAFILFGFVLELLQPERGRLHLSLLILVTAGFLATNLLAINKSFTLLGKVATEPLDLETEDIFPDKPRLTLDVQMAITEYMETEYQKNGFPIYFRSDISEYIPVFRYHLDASQTPWLGTLSPDSAYTEGNYFLITSSLGNTDKKMARYAETYTLSQKKTFGSLVIFRLEPKPSIIIALRQPVGQKEISAQEEKIGQMRVWNNLFHR